MEAKVYRALLKILFSIGHPPRGARRQFNDRWIIMVYLWSVINDRPVSWACDEQNWEKNQLDCPLPSNATMSRRLRTIGVAADHQLVAPARFVNRHVRDAKYNRPERLRTLDLLASPLERCGEPNQFGIALYNLREQAESCFGELSMKGLNYLPAWVRGPRRVAAFVAAKLILQALRCAQRKGVKAADAKS